MAISINPIFPVISAQGVAADVVLQPGTVIDAQVIKVLADDMVRIAIANLAIDVMSEIPLQVGQTLQLAVSQMDGGVKLAVVGQGAAGTAAMASEAVIGAGATPIDEAAKKIAVLQPTQNDPVGAVEALALSAAAQTSATKQAGLPQLFADLGVAADAEHLPPGLQQAILQVLARRPAIDSSFSGQDLKSAFQSSGLFLEASLAAGATPTGASTPDLKAALLVFKQVLVLQSDHLPEPTPSLSVASPPLAQATATQAEWVAADVRSQTGASFKGAVSQDTPPLVPDIEAQEIILPQSRALALADVLNPGRNFTAGLTAESAQDAVAKIALNLLQEASAVAAEQRTGAGVSNATTVDEGSFARTNTPPPPFRGALPSAQAAAVPSFPAESTPAETVRHLLEDTDAAIARQTLLQIASLPDRVDTQVLRNDTNLPRWNFEIPFATALGTAVAQFEVSRDGGQEVEAAQRVWRARFSLDVEPAGPVHALVSLSGDTTSVRMWAERPATANRLRAEAAQLGQSLSRADLTPGEIIIRDGAPPQTAKAPAGHFVDRAM